MSESSPTRVAIITGATSGIGFRAAQLLAEKPYQIILACRNQSKAEEAVATIKKNNPDALVSYHLLDLADKESIDKFSEWFLSTGLPLNVLVNNGGMMCSENGPWRTTKDGFEITFGTNHLGHFLLTMQLLEKLKETAEKCSHSRIVTVASAGHDADKVNQAKFTNHYIKPLDMDDLNLKKPGAYHFMQAYKNSKAANLLFTKALVRSLEGSGVVPLSMCPGYIPSTNILRDASLWRRFMNSIVIIFPFVSKLPVKSLDSGAQDIVSLVESEEFLEKPGIFYSNKQESEPSDEVNDVQIQNQMWLKSCEMLDRRYEHVLKQ